MAHATMTTTTDVPRIMLAIERDDAGEWIARLDCGHRRHLRHRPPLSSMPWLLDEAERNARIGQSIECGRCAQCEPPDGLEIYKTQHFDQQTLPAGLRGEHRLRPGVWGRLELQQGRLAFVADAIGCTRDLVAPAVLWIPPGVTHRVVTSGAMTMQLDFARLPPTAG